MSDDKVIKRAAVDAVLIGRKVEDVQFGMAIMVAGVTTSGVSVTHFKNEKKMDIDATVVGPGILFNASWQPNNGVRKTEEILIPFANCKAIKLKPVEK